MFPTLPSLLMVAPEVSGTVLASGTTLSDAASAESNAQFISIFWITLVALISPILSRLTGKRIPDVVFLLIFGMLIGPNVLHLAGTEGGIPLLKELGLGMLFLIAGFEINVSSLRSRQGSTALVTWGVCFGLGMLGAALITGFSHEMNTYVAVGVALSSTALGTLLPMLKSHGAAGTAVGNAVLVHGAVGELLPGLRQIIAAEANTTGQTILRLAMFLLATLIMCTALFDLDAVLGAFAAGIILRSLTPPAALHLITRRLETVGFAFTIPLFFVVSGMGISVSAVASNPLGLVAVVLGILLCRGVPVFLADMLVDTRSGLTSKSQKAQMALYSAAGLPIIVAVTEVATSSGLLEESTSSLLVAGGALTVLLFPLLALSIRRALGDSDSASEPPSRKEQMNAKKAQRNAQVKLTTGLIPTVRAEGTAQSRDEEGAPTRATAKKRAVARSSSRDSSRNLSD